MQRTLDVAIDGDVIDIIHPTVAKTKEEYIKDQTVIYELRMNSHTAVVVFRQDPSNTPLTYVTNVTLIRVHP